MHVLVIEDERLVASGIVAGLRLLGLTAHAVGSAAQASAALGTSHFDVCVLDLGLPDEDGLRLLARWRAQGQSLRLPCSIVSLLRPPARRTRACSRAAVPRARTA